MAEPAPPFDVTTGFGRDEFAAGYEPTNGDLSYPLNQSDQKAWMRFIPIAREDLYGAADTGAGPGLGDDVVDALSGAAELVVGGAAVVAGLFPSPNISSTTSSNIVAADYRINMYLPPNIMINDGINYGPTSLNILGAAAEGAVRSSDADNPLSAALMRSMVDGVASTFDAFRKIGGGAGMADRAAQLSLLRVLQRSSLPENLGAAVASGTGIALNPNVRSLLSSVNLRDFTFTFDMIPESKEEASSIQRIIDTFRGEMYPESIKGSISGVELNLGYIFPRMFIIKMYYGEKELPIDIKPVQLKNMSTNYNPGNFGWHEDGSASQTQMTLTFGEDRTLDKQSLRTLGNSATASVAAVRPRPAPARYDLRKD